MIRSPLIAFIVLAALAALVLGFLGFMEVSGCFAAWGECTYIDILNNLWRTISLFYPGGDLQGDDESNGMLAFARVLAPAATMGTIIEIVLNFFGRKITIFRASKRRDHTIIVGCGERGQHFLRDCLSDSNNRPVVIDRSGDAAIARRAHDAGALFIQGDARNTTLLGDAGLARAQQLIILGGQDGQNLEVLAAAQSVERKRPDSLDVLVRIDNALLVRQLDREDDFARKPGFNVTAFNLAAATARCFFRSHPLIDQAELRAQGRVHLVCVGWTPFVFAMLEQLARLSPFRKFPTPIVHLLVPDEYAVRTELGSVQPVLAAVLEIAYDDLDVASGIPTPEQMKAVEPSAEGAVTAVLVSIGNDAKTAAAALAIRERSQQSSRWRAPVFAHLEARSSLSGLLEKRSQEPDPGQAIIPVGFHEDVCRIDALFGEREDLARRIHGSYLAFKGVEDSTPADQRADNDQTWESLKQTYRLACRRAADHFPIKLLSIGAMQHGTPFIASGNLGFAASHDQLESLAELEHKSWEIDRRFDGWRPGKHRDNHARIHPAIVPYEDLTEGVKDFDRDQIRAIAQHLLREGDAPTVKREYRLGMFGHNRVSRSEKAHMLRELDQSVMPGLLHTYRHDFVSVCTPLAPGTDTILTEAVLEMLKDAGIDHRLIVIRTLPLQTVIEEFQPNFVDEVEWRFEEQTPPPSDWPALKKQMDTHLSTIPHSMRNAFIANQIPPGLSLDDFEAVAEQKTHAYEKAAAWLAERCDILIAYYDPAREAGRGGTRETLQWAQGDIRIPLDLSTLKPGEAAKTPRVITIEP